MEDNKSNHYENEIPINDEEDLDPHYEQDVFKKSFDVL